MVTSMKNVAVECSGTDEWQRIIEGRVLALECITAAWVFKLAQLQSAQYPISEVNKLRRELVDSISVARRPVTEDEDYADYIAGVIQQAIAAIDHMMRNVEIRLRD